jgi:hypothetical protein
VVTATVNLEELVSFRSLAKTLGMTLTGVHGWRKKGVSIDGVRLKLHAIRIGGNWFTTKQDIQNFILAQSPANQLTPEANWLNEQQQTAKALKGGTSDRNINRRGRVSGVRKPADAADAASLTEHESQ